MREDLREQIAAYDIISFDVFDTLLSRAIATPVDAFNVVKARLVTSDLALHHPRIVDGFPTLRVQAEQSARARKQHPDAEVTFDDIYAAFAALTGADEAACRRLRECELATERSLVYANPAGRQLFDAARRAGKTIIFCSDMYHSASEIRRLLADCGYVGTDDIYVSCEHGTSKHHGGLFTRIAELRGVDAAGILHIGDNEHSDVAMARSAGWDALHLPASPMPEAFDDGPWIADDGDRSRTVSAIIRGLLRQRDADDAAFDDPWAEIGFRVYGPLFTGFLLYLQAAMEQRMPERVLLLARDTYALKPFLERFLAARPDAPALDYVYVSRGSILFASMTDFATARLKHLVSGRARRSVGEHLRRFGLNPHVHVAEAVASGFTSLEELVQNGDERMIVLLKKLYVDLLRASARLRPLVREYVRSFVSGARDVMLVDIGWVGNMQAALARLFAQSEPQLHLRGCYVGTFRSAAENAVPGHTMNGWLTRASDHAAVERAMWWAGGVELLEFAMAAPHGTTLGYERAPDGSVRPVLEHGEDEAAVTAQAARVQRGAAAFVEAFLASYGDIPASGLDDRSWAAPFYRLVTEPTALEAALLGEITHSDTAGETTLRLPLAPQALDGESLLERYDASYWKAGFVVRNELASESDYDDAIYLALNPDVREALERGDIASGLEHWRAHGAAEGRVATWMGRTR